MSERGLLAPLSPHEEVTLRHVALGIANPADLAARDVERLRALMLVEEHETTLRRSRLESNAIATFRTVPPSTQAHPTQPLEKMAEFISKARD